MYYHINFIARTLFGARYITRDSELLVRGKHRTLHVPDV